MDISGKTIVISGATGGIGSEIVRKLKGEHAKLVLLGTNEEKLNILVQKLELSDCKTFAEDFTSLSNISTLSNKLLADYPTIDILLNCAGIGVYKAIEDVTEEDWSNSFSINVAAPYFLTKYLLPSLQKSTESIVVNIGSGMGVIPSAGRSVYCASKFALRGATLSLAEEFKHTSVSLCLITLGSTLTDFGPMTIAEKQREMLDGKAYFTPEWVAEKLVTLLKDEKRDSEITLYPSDYGRGKWEKPEQ